MNKFTIGLMQLLTLCAGVGGILWILYYWGETWKGWVFAAVITCFFAFIYLKFEQHNSDIREKELRHYALREGLHYSRNPSDTFFKKLPQLPVFERTGRFHGILEKRHHSLSQWYCDREFFSSSSEIPNLRNILAIYDIKQPLFPLFQIKKRIWGKGYYLKFLESPSTNNLSNLEKQEYLKKIFNTDLVPLLKDKDDWAIEGEGNWLVIYQDVTDYHFISADKLPSFIQEADHIAQLFYQAYRNK